MTSKAKRNMKIEGARTHNLKNLNLEIPLNSFVVVTGKSGSGKSSLAIDTIFAEGQRQYVESLSLYARNFFPISSTIDVDSISGLQPTVCIAQNRGSANPRSTVGTLTEVYDNLRLLMAKVGKANCPGCGKQVSPLTRHQICEAILAIPEGTKAMVLAPLVRGRKGKHTAVFEEIRKQRLVRVRIDGQLHDIEDLPELSSSKLHNIEAVTDRIVVHEGIEERLMEAVELAIAMSGGMVMLCRKLEGDHWEDSLYSSHAGCRDCGIEVPVLEPRLFSFNSPYGACPTCNGLGRLESFAVSRIVPDRGKSIDDGAIAIWRGRSGEKKKLKSLQPILDHLRVKKDQCLDTLSAKSFGQLMTCDSKKTPGLLLLLEKEFSTCVDEDEFDWMEQFRGGVKCQNCHGSRLNERANSVLLGGQSTGQLSQMQILELTAFLDSLELGDDESQIADQILPVMKKRLGYLVEVGLHYLTLNRPSDSLSGGELQRVRLATAIGSGLSGTCYVLDEPTVGMHERDTQRLIQSLRKLQRRGNSLVVVEHDEALMREADHIIDLGPGAGEQGGTIVGAGDCEQLMRSAKSLTGDFLSGREKVTVPASSTRSNQGSVKLTGARGFNLKAVDVEFPLGKLICVTGVSGSGKSTLVNATLAPAIRQHLGLLTNGPLPFDGIIGLDSIQKLVRVDQRAISRSSRGCAATYTGILDDIRKIYGATKTARMKGYGASRFSFNSSSGRCGECKGHGVKKVSMRFMADMSVPCGSCHGKRYNEATLAVKFRNYSIADVLQMSVDQAVNHFQAFDRLHAKLFSLQQVGLGYLSLGQPSTTLSGGEAQRIKLSVALASRSEAGTIYLLDEPTTGLHVHDVQLIMNVLAGIVDRGNTVIVIEHNLDVIRCADWVIDLGPDAGEQGGEVVVAGSLRDVMDCADSETGKSLRQRTKKAH